MPAGGGPEHGEVAALPLLDLEVQPGAATAEGADELADEALALDPPHPGDDRQTGVEVEREGVLPGFDDQPLHSHGVVIGATERDLKPDLGRTAHVKPPRFGHTSRHRRRRRTNGAIARAALYCVQSLRRRWGPATPS